VRVLTADAAGACAAAEELPPVDDEQDDSAVPRTMLTVHTSGVVVMGF